MPQYRIDQKPDGVAIELSDIAGHHDALLQTFADCQAGQCGCPTDEYQKIADMAVESADDSMTLRLRAESGETFDTSEISACLEFTLSQLGSA